MRKIISFTHMSLDGFVAALDGGFDWIVYDDTLASDARDLTNGVDAALYGRNTYQGMESYWPTVPGNPDAAPTELEHAEWIEKIHKIVFSRTLDGVTWNNTTLIKENIAEELGKIKAQPGGNMLIFGSPGLTHSLARLGLVDQYRININPVVLGSGVPLFEEGQTRAKLSLLESKNFPNGVIGTLYEVER